VTRWRDGRCGLLTMSRVQRLSSELSIAIFVNLGLYLDFKGRG
jgi:hypothetical protein